MIKKLLITASSLVATTAYDCDVGCSLNANEMGPPVCGADGLTYANECLAYCQDVELDSYGPCDSPLVESELLVDDEVINGTTMRRFADENFRFVMKRTKFATEVEDMEDLSMFDDYVLNEMGGDRHFVRITSEGYEYSSRYSLLNETVGPTTPYKGLAEGYEFIVQNRNLIIIGNDTRSAVPDTTIFPYRAIGAADYAWGDNGCTATMISRTSALTAAHCVWNYVEARPMPMTRLAPGRYHDPTKSPPTAQPFGMWEVDYTTSFGAYREFRSSAFDMAVVTYKPVNRPDLGCSEVYPGDIVGFVGIDSVTGTSTAVIDHRTSTITVTGYPYDFRRGEMTTSGPCSPEPRSHGPHFLRHFCDTLGGMSGSALFTDDNIALGNHAGGLGATNAGPVMSKEMFDAVYTWAGLDQTQQLCPPVGSVVVADCPCQSGGNPWHQILCWFLNIQGCLRVARDSVMQG